MSRRFEVKVKVIFLTLLFGCVLTTRLVCGSTQTQSVPKKIVFQHAKNNGIDILMGSCFTPEGVIFPVGPSHVPTLFSRSGQPICPFENTSPLLKGKALRGSLFFTTPATIYRYAAECCAIVQYSTRGIIESVTPLHRGGKAISHTTEYPERIAGSSDYFYFVQNPILFQGGKNQDGTIHQYDHHGKFIRAFSPLVEGNPNLFGYNYSMVTTDFQGNLYQMFGGGRTILRKFAKDGRLVFEKRYPDLASAPESKVARGADRYRVFLGGFDFSPHGLAVTLGTDVILLDPANGNILKKESLKGYNDNLSRFLMCDELTGAIYMMNADKTAPYLTLWKN